MISKSLYKVILRAVSVELVYYAHTEYYYTAVDKAIERCADNNPQAIVHFVSCEKVHGGFVE